MKHILAFTVIISLFSLVPTELQAQKQTSSRRPSETKKSSIPSDSIIEDEVTSEAITLTTFFEGGWQIISGKKPAKPDQTVKSSKQIAQMALPASVSITTYTSEGRLVLGSGFYAMPQLIITNQHVIKNAKTIYAQGVFNDDQNKYLCSVVASDTSIDLAILKVDQPHSVIQINPKYKLQIGEKIYAVGNPRGLSGTFSEGIVSGKRVIDNELNYLIQHTAPASPGSSGGPLLNAKGEVVGIIVSSVESGQNLNFAIPINALGPLANKAYESLHNAARLAEAGVQPSPPNASVARPEETNPVKTETPRHWQDAQLARLNQSINALKEKAKRLNAYARDFFQFAQSRKYDNLEFDLTKDLSEVAEVSGYLVDAIVTTLEIYSRLSSDADHSSIKPLIKSQLQYYSNLLTEQIKGVNNSISFTRMPAVATSGTQMKADLREIKELFESMELP